jgi:hypothetical protein
MTPRIYLDTSVLKLAVQRRIEARSRVTTVDWGSKIMRVPVVEYVAVDPVDGEHFRQRRQARRLPFIAWLALSDRIQLLRQLETLWEFAMLKSSRGAYGDFFGAKITSVDAPVRYGRVIAGGSQSGRDAQRDFLKKLQHPRFLQLQKATGAYQGKNPVAENELLDAFHIWCAEFIGADSFLTADVDLVDHVTSHKRFPPKVIVETPLQLVARFAKLELFRSHELAEYRRFRRRTAYTSPHPLEPFVELGQLLRSRGYYDPHL